MPATLPRHRAATGEGPDADRGARVVSEGERSGGPVKTEEDPLDSRPVPFSVRTVAAVRHVEKTVPLAAPEGIVLRYGSFGWEPRPVGGMRASLDIVAAVSGGCSGRIRRRDPMIVRRADRLPSERTLVRMDR